MDRTETFRRLAERLGWEVAAEAALRQQDELVAHQRAFGQIRHDQAVWRTDPAPTYRAARIRFPEGVTPGDAAKEVGMFLAQHARLLYLQSTLGSTPKPGPDAVTLVERGCDCGRHALVDVWGAFPWLPHGEGELLEAIDFPAFRRLVPPRRPASREARDPAGTDGMGRRWLP